MDEFDDPGSLFVHFEKLEDPRIDRTKKYPLHEIIFIVIVGVICNCDSWRQIILMAETKSDWLKKFIKLEHGIPSHDTIARVFSLINPKKFQECFSSWVASLGAITSGEVVAIDGKMTGGSWRNSENMLYIVSAWADKMSLVLGQEKVADKSNEITAIPKLLDILEIKGAIVTIDAIGCQTEIAEKIVNEKKADYCLAIKGNQGNTFDEIKEFFSCQNLAKLTEIPGAFLETCDKEHGRVETRQYYHVNVADYPDWLEKTAEFPCIKGIVLNRQTREFTAGKAAEHHDRYFLTSFPQDAKKAGYAIRSHWGIENKLHWILDVGFNDDTVKIRKDHAPENFAFVKKCVFNLLKKDTSRKDISLKMKRYYAAIREPFLENIIGQLN